MKALILGTFISVLAAASVAQDVRPLSEFEEDRAHYNQQSDLACAGDESAFARLEAAADPAQNGEPTAQAALAWLVASEQCAYYTGDDEQITYYYILAAQNGYPVGFAYAGIRMIRGLGIPQNTESGAGLAMLGLEGGFGDAGAMLAGELITGIHMERDLASAKLLLAAAEDLGASPALLSNVQSAYDAASE